MKTQNTLFFALILGAACTANAADQMQTQKKEQYAQLRRQTIDWDYFTRPQTPTIVQAIGHKIEIDPTYMKSQTSAPQQQELAQRITTYGKDDEEGSVVVVDNDEITQQMMSAGALNDKDTIAFLEQKVAKQEQQIKRQNTCLQIQENEADAIMATKENAMAIEKQDITNQTNSLKTMLQARKKNKKPQTQEESKE